MQMSFHTMQTGIKHKGSRVHVVHTAKTGAYTLLVNHNGRWKEGACDGMSVCSPSRPTAEEAVTRRKLGKIDRINKVAGNH